jgi:hypothetical protein
VIKTHKKSKTYLSEEDEADNNQSTDYSIEKSEEYNHQNETGSSIILTEFHIIEKTNIENSLAF